MTVRVLQLTDLHLFTDPAGEVRGVRTRETFERVLSVVNQHFSAADRLILTGDLTHDEQLSTYEFLKSRLEPWWSRLRVLPGNHDCRELLQSVFADQAAARDGRIGFHDQAPGWELIGLDSHLPGSTAGRLGLAQLGWLDETLQRGTARSTCLFLHHPPLDVDSAWLDRIKLEDGAELLEIVQRSPQVRAMFLGHVHQERTIVQDRLVGFSAPSTGVQFRPETAALEVDVRPPGFRVIDLYADGTLQTHVERIS